MQRLLSLSLGISLWLTSSSQLTLAQDRACCLSDGNCLYTNQAGCDIGSGDYLGDGTTCATTVCIGACCLDEKTCAEDSLDGCDGSGGTFQGPNTTCDLHCAAKLPTVFTYQGQLKQAGVPLSGTADIEFTLWTSSKGGDQVGDMVLKENISVANGLLSVPLDFGVSVFNGNARWLEIAVRSPHDETDTELFTTLLPRQLITATPYALQTRGLFVSDEGNVGIGTTTPNANLEVIGDRIRLVDTDNAHLQIANSSSNMWTWRAGSDGDLTLQVSEYDGSPYGASNHTLMSVESNGNVGIGTTTPLDPLHVTGSVRSEGGAFRSISPSGAGEVFLGWGVDGDGDEMARIRIGGGSPGGTNGLDIQRTSNVSLMRIMHSGNVGIGTTTPEHKLEVAKSSNGVAVYAHNFRGGSSFGPNGLATYGVFGSCSSDSPESKYGIYGTAKGNGGTKYGVYGRTSGGGTNYAGYFVGNGYFSGRLGIGTETPQGKLDVNGSIYHRGVSLHADYVFDSDYDLESIEDHSDFMWSEGHLPAVPQGRKDSEGRDIIEVGSHRRGILEELEKAHIYIERLNAEKDCLVEQLATVETEAEEKDKRLVNLEGRFTRLEELLMQLSRDVQRGGQ